MTHFQISNSASAVVLGIFQAETEAQALDMLAVAAGYKSQADAVIPSSVDLVVEDVTNDVAFVAEFIGAGVKDAVENHGQDYRDWTDASTACEIYADFGNWDEDELSADQKRVVELLDGNADFVDAGDGIVDTWLEKMQAEADAEFTDAVRAYADSLDELQTALKAADAYADKHGLDRASLYDATHLPRFGGDEPSHTSEIYSWDESFLLIQDGFGAWTQVAR